MKGLAWGTALGLLALLGLAPGARADTAGELAERLRKATSVLGGMAAGQQDTAIPREMLGRARAIGVFPQVKKGAVIAGGRHGQVIDLVLVVMSDKGVESLLKSETTLGGDVSLTAGPKSLHEAANTGGGAIRTLYGPKADSRDILLTGRYAAPASAQPFVKVLATYSPPPKKR
jgi:lipid-binding SYLF domain-containing protein